MRSGRYIITLLAILSGCPVLAGADEFSFQASVDHKEVALGEQVTLRVSISAPDPDVAKDLKLPDTGSLKVTGTSQEESSSFSLSGGAQSFRSTKTVILYLSPTRLGKTRIGRASISYKGKKYQTNPIDIQVVKASKRPKTQPRHRARRWPSVFDDDFFRSPFDDYPARRREINKDDIFVRAYLSPDVVVEGQQITVTVMVYSRIYASIASIRWPKLDGFFSVDRDVTRAKMDQKYIDGVLYRTKVIDQKALFPLQPGEVSIGRVEVEVALSQSPFFPSQELKLRTAPLKVKVLELPQEGQPKDFHRANVGSYQLTAQVDSNQVGLNQPVTYTVDVRGTGNIQRLRPPELPALPRFKRFDPTVDVNVSKRGRRVRGSKTFEYILVPLASGKLTIPGLEFSFYDTQAGQYRTLTTQDETIEVSASQTSPGTTAAKAGREINILSGALKPIRFESTLFGLGEPFYRHGLFLPLLVVPPLLYLLVMAVAFFRTQARSDSQRNRMRRAWARGRKHLKAAGQLACTGEVEDFFAELNAALMDGIEARTGLAPAGLTLGELKVRLQRAGISGEVIDGLCSESENCDFGRFAPATSRGEEMQSSLERVRRLMKQLERERVRPVEESR